MNKSLENRLKLIAGDSNVRCDEPMSSHCTFRAGGTAKYYVIPDEYKKVRECSAFMCRRKIFHIMSLEMEVIY